MANLDYNDFRRRDCVWRMVLPANSLKLLNGGMAPSYSGHPARAPPGARASTSSDRSTAASTASFNPVPLQTAKVVLGCVLINAQIAAGLRAYFAVTLYESKRFCVRALSFALNKSIHCKVPVSFPKISTDCKLPLSFPKNSTHCHRRSGACSASAALGGGRRNRELPVTHAPRFPFT